MANIYVVGDIHGEYQKLKALLTKVNFDYDNDTLISLGDVVDRGSDSYSVIEELLKIKNLIAIQGNHDECWFNAMQENRYENYALWHQGAKQTYESYVKARVDPKIHYDFFSNQKKIPHHDYR